MRMLIILLLLPLTCPLANADDPLGLEPWDRVVCIHSQSESKPDTVNLCSAFFVISNDQLFLVTAGHAAAETNLNSKIHYRDPAGKSQWISLKGFVVLKSGNPWHHDSVSDLAIAKLPPVEGAEIYHDHFRKIAIPLESVRKNAPPRTTQVVTAGFPLAIGAKGDISPVAVVGHIASRETTATNSWGEEPIIYCSPALAKGTSGGPTFQQPEANGELSVIGMYIGFAHDGTGAKLSRMVPGRIIHEAIIGLQDAE